MSILETGLMIYIGFSWVISIPALRYIASSQKTTPGVALSSILLIVVNPMLILYMFYYLLKGRV